MYEISDHGSIILIGKEYESTDYIEFSADEGKTW